MRSADHQSHRLISGVSYNQPKINTSACWFPNATTLTTSATIGTLPQAVFVDGINNVYVASRLNNTVLIWPQYSTAPAGNRSGNLNRPHSLFVSILGDVYVDNGFVNGRVDRFLFNSAIATPVMNVSASCFGLFLDSQNYLYCSLRSLHQVVRLLIDSAATMPNVAAGNGIAGSASNMLDSPHGIVVDSSQNLYVADCGNDRIQRVQTGQTNGVTVVGEDAPSTITLDCPTGIVLDSDGYLFIVDSFNHRIVGSGPYGYRCIAGCSGSNGTSAAQLSFPQTMAFDSYANIYVTDRNNSRVQVFVPQKNCRK